MDGITKSEVLTKMMDRIVHRGPDMGGQFIDGRAPSGCRLSILDLTEAGAQPPMANDGSVACPHRRDLPRTRSELEAKG